MKYSASFPVSLLPGAASDNHLGCWSEKCTCRHEGNVCFISSNRYFRSPCNRSSKKRCRFTPRLPVQASFETQHPLPPKRWWCTFTIQPSTNSRRLLCKRRIIDRERGVYDQPAGRYLRSFWVVRSFTRSFCFAFPRLVRNDCTMPLAVCGSMSRDQPLLNTME